MWNRISTLLPSHHHRQNEDITLTQGRGALININIRTRTSHWSDTGRGALIKARPLTPCCPHLPLSEVSTFIFNTKIQNTLLISSSFHQIWQYIYKDSKHIYIWLSKAFTAIAASSVVSTSISNTKIQKLQQMLFNWLWLEICHQTQRSTSFAIHG